MMEQMFPHHNGISFSSVSLVLSSSTTTRPPLGVPDTGHRNKSETDAVAPVAAPLASPSSSSSSSLLQQVRNEWQQELNSLDRGRNAMRETSPTTHIAAPSSNLSLLLLPKGRLQAVSWLYSHVKQPSVWRRLAERFPSRACVSSHNERKEGTAALHDNDDDDETAALFENCMFLHEAAAPIARPTHKEQKQESTTMDSAGPLLSLDAVVYLGGYEGADLLRTVYPTLLAELPDRRHLGQHSIGTICDYEQVEYDRQPQYIKAFHLKRQMKQKGCVVCEDCVQLVLPPWSPRSPERNELSTAAAAAAATGRSSLQQSSTTTNTNDRTAAEGTIVPLPSPDSPSALPVHKEVGCFIGFGNMEWTPSHLNHTDWEHERVAIRTSLGYSEALLRRRLPSVVVHAATELQRRYRRQLQDQNGGRTAQAPPRRNRHGPAHRAQGRAQHQRQHHREVKDANLPPFVFWISCVAHVLDCPEMVEKGSCDPSISKSVLSVTSEDVEESLRESKRLDRCDDAVQQPHPSNNVFAEVSQWLQDCVWERVVPCSERSFDNDPMKRETSLPVAVLVGQNYFLPAESFRGTRWAKHLLNPVPSRARN